MDQSYTQQPEKATSALVSDLKVALTNKQLPSIKEIRTSNPTNEVGSETFSTCVKAKSTVNKYGIATAFRKLSEKMKNAQSPVAKSYSSLWQFPKALYWIAFLFSVIVPVLSFSRGLLFNPVDAVLYFLSLLFIMLPEKFSQIKTVVVSKGIHALSIRGIIIKNPKTAETLGNVNVIVTDKVGILTENRSFIVHLFFDGKIKSLHEFGINEKSALKTAFLSCTLGGAIDLNNTIAKTILEYLTKEGLDTKSLTEEWSIKDEIPFDSKRELSSFLYQFNTATVVLSSGSPERFLEKTSKVLLEGREIPITDAFRTQISNITRYMEFNGEHLLAFGYHRLSSGTEDNKEMWEIDFVLVGIIGFNDSPYKGVRDAIQSCKNAGIRVIMISSDSPEVAISFAGKVGINNTKVVSGKEIAVLSDYTLKKIVEETSVYSRITSEDKLRILRLLSEKAVVAVTGCNVTDVSSLKKAHVGIVPLKSAPALATGSSIIELADYKFGFIESAVKEARKLFCNITKSLQYYLTCKLAIIFLFFTSIIFGVPLPFLPIHLIIFELLIYVAASAISIGEPPEQSLMKESSKLEKWCIDSMPLKKVFLGAFSLFLTVTIAYLFAYYTSLDPVYSITASFTAWMLSHLFLIFNFRTQKESILKHGLLSNKLVTIWILSVMSFLLMISTLPLIQSALNLTTLHLTDWVIVISLPFIAPFLIELTKETIQKSSRDSIN